MNATDNPVSGSGGVGQISQATYCVSQEDMGACNRDIGAQLRSQPILRWT